MRHQKILVFIFFGLFLALGLSLYKDYGIHFDDQLGRENGFVNGCFIANKVAPEFLKKNGSCVGMIDLKNWRDADHGPVFELVPTFLEWAFNIEDLLQAYQIRHLCVFLLFYLSCIFFYLLLQERFQQPLLSLLGVIMLVLSPRIFAESFFNTKDIPFLSLSVISTYTLIKYLKNPSVKTVFWHALTCALAIDVRLLGLVFPAITLGFSFLDLQLFRNNGRPIVKTLLLAGLYLAMLSGFIFMFWPYLWVMPVYKITEVIKVSMAYPWNGTLLYLGKEISSNNLPWHYLPVWFFITTPTGYFVLFFAGLITIISSCTKNGLKLYNAFAEQFDLIIAATFLLPFLATVLLKLTIYDSWRHLYFIYPFFTALSLIGLRSVFLIINAIGKQALRKTVRFSLYAIVFLYLGSILSWLIRNHPHQNVYFSIYKNNSVRHSFELDYWGLSYKQGLEFIVKDTDQPVIKVLVANLPGYYNQFMLPLNERSRLVYVNKMEDADYYLTEYRWQKKEIPLQKEVYHIKVDDIKILSVFKPNMAN